MVNGSFSLPFFHWKQQKAVQVNPEIIWMFPKIGVPQNGWFIMENLIKMDDLGVLKAPLFSVQHPYEFERSRFL